MPILVLFKPLRDETEQRKSGAVTVVNVLSIRPGDGLR